MEIYKKKIKGRAIKQSEGYREMLQSLERYLSSITGFAATSLQPTSGASDEYAGLLCIQKYLESIGEGHRKVCAIPKSAHGSNPATAAMYGMKIMWIDDSKEMDLDAFRKLCEDNMKDVAALMLTYPSTRTFFKQNIQEICAMVAIAIHVMHS